MGSYSMKLDLKAAKLPLLRATALALAADVDRGNQEARRELELVMARIPGAKDLGRDALLPTN